MSWIQHPGLYESSERCLRLVIGLFDVGSLTDFTDYLSHGEAVVRIGIEDAVDFIEPFYIFRSIVSFVSNSIADILTVFLFNVGGVILFVGAAPGELKVFVLGVGYEVVVEKLRSVICVKAPGAVGPVGDDAVEFCEDSGPSAAENRSSAAESRDHIDNAEGIGVVAMRGAAVVLHQVAFQCAGSLFIPGIRLHRNLTLDG